MAGAPVGNQNAAKSKRMFTSALKRLFVQSPERADALAERLIGYAESGESWAFKELIDRLDGKAPQPIVGDDDEAPIRFSKIERTIVDPANTDS